MEKIYKFPSKSIITKKEKDFLHEHTPETVLNMIKQGTYDSKLSAFLNKINPPKEQDNISIQELFRKELTHSDVGQRKGLIIPKKDAEEFLPELADKNGKGIFIRFLDRQSYEWVDFRYNFYKSSQSYVMTTGWSRFVKIKELKKKDVIRFYMCTKYDEEMYIMIDVERGSKHDDLMEVAHDGHVEMYKSEKGVKLFGVLIG